MVDLKFPDLPPPGRDHFFIAQVVRAHLERFNAEPQLWESDWDSVTSIEHVRAVLSLPADVSNTVGGILALYQHHFNQSVLQYVQTVICKGQPAYAEVLDHLAR